jgi:hypothetical protein
MVRYLSLLSILTDQFDNELVFRVGDTILTGEFRRQDKTGSSLPVKAERGITSRFPETGLPPAGDLSGYDQVFGGIADKQGVANSLPALNTFLAFPTTILIDRKGRVAKIHTGYSGPATGIYYRQFVKEFNKEIDLFLKV